MKKNKSLILHALTAVFVLAVLTAASFAWLSGNKKSDSNSAQFKIDVSPNLIISNDTDEIVKAAITDINSGSPFSITFAANNSRYKPSTHDSEYGTYPAGLKYVTNPGDVDAVSGLAKAGKSLTDTGVVANSSPSPYFEDFVIYVSSHGEPMENVKLKAVITSARENGAEITGGSLSAMTVDIYAGTTISLDNYRGSLNVTEKNSGARYLFDSATHGTTAVSGTVPSNRANGNNYLTYTLRCYFDGALTNGGTAYINTASLDTSTVTLTMQIIAEE